MKPVFALVTYRGAEKFSDNQRKRADNSYEDRKHKGDPYGSRLFSLGMSRAIHEEPSNRTQHLAISYDIYKYGFYRAPVLLDYGAFALVTHSPGRNPRNLPGLFLFTSAYSQSERDCLADAALGLIENSANLSLFRSPFGRGARSERIFFQEFLTVRQELKRFERKTLGYSKSLEMHKLAVALHFRAQTSHARNHASRCGWSGRKAVEFRTGSSRNDR